MAKPDIETGLTQNIVEERETVRLNEHWAQAGMSTLSSGLMMVGAGRNIQEAIRKEQEQRRTQDLVHDIVLQQIADLQDDIAGWQKENRDYQKQNTAINDALEDVENGTATVDDISKRPEIMQALEAYKKRTGREVDVNSPDFLMILTEIKEYNEEQIELNNDRIQNAQDQIGELKGGQDNVEKIRNIIDENNLTEQDASKLVSDIENAEIQKDAYEAKGINEDTASRLVETFGSSESKQKTSEFESIFDNDISVASALTDGLSNRSIKSDFENAVQSLEVASIDKNPSTPKEELTSAQSLTI